MTPQIIPPAVLDAARAVADTYGPQALTARWLDTNGYRSLRRTLEQHGDLGCVREQLGVTAPVRRRRWTDDALLDAARAVIDQHGEASLTNRWLKANGYTSLDSAIRRRSMAWVREQLGLAERKKEPGYWSPERVIAEAQALADAHGAAAINDRWLLANGHHTLRQRCTQLGGIPWLREQLGLPPACRAPYRAAWTAERVISEARALVDEHGMEALTRRWLEAHGHWALRSAIGRCGGFRAIRRLMDTAS